MRAITLVALACLGCTTDRPASSPPAVVPISTATVTPGDFQATIDLFGEVRAHNRVPIQVVDSGAVRYRPRFAKGLRLGAEVAKGEPLLELVNRDAELALATGLLEQRSAAADVERARRGVEEGFMADIELQRARLQLELAEERLAHARERNQRLVVAAPASGYLIVETPVAEGAEVAPGTVLGYVGERGPARIEGHVAASDLPRVSLGQVVECRLPGGHDPVALARVREIAREIDALGSARVVAEVTEDLGLPAAGEGLELKVLLERRESVLSVPLEAVLRRGGLAYVFVLEPRGEDLSAERRPVLLGGLGSGRAEVLNGLRAGERVAVTGLEFLTDGASARDVGSASAGGGR